MLGKKQENRIRSKAWLDLLTGEKIEKANTRVDAKSNISYDYYERVIDDNTGEEQMRKIKWKK